MKNILMLIVFAISILKGSAIAQTVGTFTDSRDNKVYSTLTLGSQCWMTQNLAYKASAGCYAYLNDTNNVAAYGYLYNWFTAKSACPLGWHLPSDKEWKILIQYYGGEKIAGGKLKEAGTTHWKSAASDAKDTIFKLRPGGFINGFGVFSGIGECGIWWCSDFHTSMNAWYYYILHSDSKIKRRSVIMTSAMSVICIKD